MSAIPNLLSRGPYYIYDDANDDISSNGMLTWLTCRLFDDALARVNSALEPAVVCKITRLFQERLLYVRLN
jgi:hypothetical protein